MAHSRKRPRKTERPEGDALDRYERWTSRVTRARKVREEWERRFHVEEAEAFFLGDQWRAGEFGRVMNHFHATVKTIKPNLVFQSPKFYCRPKPGQSVHAARASQIAEGVLETIGAQDDHLRQAASLAALQSLFRIGVLKVCYDPRLEPNPQKGEPVYAKDEQGMVVMNGDIPVPAVNPMTGEPITEPAEVVTDEVYRYHWVDATHMLLPDEGPDIGRWSWIGEEVYVPLEQAQADTRFPEARRRLFRANVRKDKRPNSFGRRSEQGLAEELFCYVEVYDVRQKRLLIWADGQDEDGFLVDDPLPDGIEDHPYALLAFTPIIGPEPSPWPMPVVQPWLDPQREYNIKRQQIIEGGKRAARKGYITEDMFPNPEEAKKALASPVDMEFATVNEITRLPVVMEVPNLSADLYQDVALLRSDWQLITGQSGARMGTGDAADTATESIFIERAANLRDADMQGQAQAWLAMAGRKMWQLLRQTLSLDLWIRLRGFDDDEFRLYVQEVYGVNVQQLFMYPGLKELFREQYGTETPLRVSRDELQFEVDVQVVPGSQRPQTLEIEKRTAFEFLGFLGQYPQLALSRGLMQWVAAKFDPPIPRPVLDELHALAKQMVAINANQAGRNQGGDNGQQTPGAPTASPAGTLAPLFQALIGAQG